MDGAAGRSTERDLAVTAQGRPLTPVRDTVVVCVVRDRDIRLEQAEQDPESGDTLVQGAPSGPIYARYAPPYADAAEWFVRKDLVDFRSRKYVWNGPRLAFPPDSVKRIGEFKGIPLFALAKELPGDVGMLLVPVEPGCEFQPYYYFNDTGPVRG